jgi:NADH-quinone oxidoreductase subunit L
MGGMKAKMPTTYWTFGIATLAIAGIIPFAGFFSKDEILAGAWFGGHRVVWGVLAVAAAITAFYMTRLTWRVFFGKFRGGDEAWQKAHESPRTMTVPLMILAVLSLVGGWIGIPKVMSGWFGAGDVNYFHHWLEPAITLPGGGHGEAAHGAVAHDAGLESMLIVIALVVAVAGIALALTVYRTAGLAERLARGAGPAYTLVRNLYWVDELYELLILRPFYALSRFFTGFDRWVVDGLVNAAGISADISGQVIKLFQTGRVRNYALMVLIGVVAILIYLMSL